MKTLLILMMSLCLFNCAPGADAPYSEQIKTRNCIVGGGSFHPPYKIYHDLDIINTEYKLVEVDISVCKTMDYRDGLGSVPVR